MNLNEWLSQLEAIEKAATPGPWRLDDESFYHGETNDLARSILGNGGYGVISCAKTDFPDEENGLLIAAARNSLPLLLQIVRVQANTIELMSKQHIRGEYEDADLDPVSENQEAYAYNCVVKDARAARAEVEKLLAGEGNK